MTQGISPKTIAAFFYPFIATCVTVGIKWLSEGKFDRASLVMGISGLAASGLATLGAYIHSPGNTVVNVDIASDQLLGEVERAHAANESPPQEETVSPPSQSQPPQLGVSVPNA